MIPATQQTFTRVVENLVRKFENDRETYMSPGYGEAQARSHFITPFFKALGWDVENEAAVPFHLCEVWEEKGETEGRPDYTFRIEGQTKFFIEAKAPSVTLGNAGPILQTKSYAWSSKDVLVAGLTHFEEFRFFDASLEPDERRLFDGQAFHLQCTEYLDNINLLWELSPTRVAAGSLEQFVRKDRRLSRFRIPVDKRFLDELNEWRHDLASSIHKLNPAIDARQLSDIVQRLLDRIVFIRIAEERKVIESGQLRELIEVWQQRGGKVPIMQGLVSLFSDINRDFNGEIFKPHPCERVNVDSIVLSKIIRRLYPPKSPYRFDVIGVELLGSIYERYLGNTLTVTAKQVRIEPKPEVRKAGGVYYTPKFVVDFIVANTVGKLLEGKNPSEVEALRIIDPACGSGSFLIGAYQCLMDWHLAYYHEHPQEALKHAMYPEVETDRDGTQRLTFHAKTRILRQNLYGLDVDNQAVEVTMMSLYLKAFEAEKGLLVPRQQLLPELKYNIRCGNSLVGPDIEKIQPLSAEERSRMLPFDWHSREDGFGDILASGGFDAVIGNPPYGADCTELEKQYFKSQFITKKGKPETYIYFLERGVSILRAGGRLGFITPNAWLTNHYGVQLRNHLLDSMELEQMVDLEPTRVFEGVVVDTVITVLSKPLGSDSDDHITLVSTGTRDKQINPSFAAQQQTWRRQENAIINLQAAPDDSALLTYLNSAESKLETIVEYSQGVIPYKTKEDGELNKYIKQTRNGKGWLPLLESASQVQRYAVGEPSSFIKYGDWLWCSREKRFFDNPKILFHRLRKKLPQQLVAGYDDSGVVNRHSLSNLILRPNEDPRTLLAVLALFNSKLANWWFVKTFGILMEVGGFKVGKIPLPTNWVAGRQRLAQLAEERIVLGRTLNPRRGAAVPNPILEIESAIDGYLFELFELSPQQRELIGKHNPQHNLLE